MRIAQVSAHTSPLAPLGGRETGGMNVYVLELSHELARLGYEVDIFTRRDGDLPRVEQVAANLRLVRLDAGPPEPVEKEEIVACLPDFARDMRRFTHGEGRGYDIIHSHYWQSAWAARAIARHLRVPHVVMFHTLGEVKNRARISEQEPARRIRHERAIVRRADALVTASAHERQLLARYYGARDAQMHTIPCGVDIGLFRPRDRQASRRRLGLEQAGPVLLWVGRLEKLKGVDILIQALAELDERHFTLLVVGGDERAADLKAELQHQAAASGLAANVRFVGAVPHDQLPVYYSAADVCVVPSYYESFGLVAVEAMACGTPVVASRVGGLVSSVIDGVTGYLIPWRCPGPFAEKLEVLLHNPELRANFGAAARRSVERFRWESVALQVAGVYDRVLAAHREREAGTGFGAEVYEAAVLAGSRR
ncbi:MAG: glycosyltransferase [Dehalococcoidia bacterium]|nr:glycosyltransferase [Dehalococcoidia bacterium]NUQ56023.1 glycosyltransferase [Dehalococcoidia bacterium]